MTLTLIKQAPELLEKPIIVMDSLTRQDSLVILGELYTKKRNTSYAFAISGP